MELSMSIDILEQSPTQQCYIKIKPLLNNARDYIERCKELCSLDATYSTEIQKKTDALSKHVFAGWLNERPNFLNTRKKLINKKLIHSNVSEVGQGDLLALRKIHRLKRFLLCRINRKK